MSEIRVDNITDEAGTGSPLAPNGLQVENGINATNGGLSNKSEFGVLATNRFEGIGDSTPIIEFGMNQEVLMPNQPAFLASLSSNFDSTTRINFLTFDMTDYNIGNHYSTSTGRFTAPISGLYQFILKLQTETNTFTEVKIYKNGNEIIRSYNPTGGNSNLRTGWAIGNVSLSTGDYVQGVFYDGSNGDGSIRGNSNDINNFSSSFQGYLIG